MPVLETGGCDGRGGSSPLEGTILRIHTATKTSTSNGEVWDRSPPNKVTCL
jgi:hypothetical protein